MIAKLQKNLQFVSSIEMLRKLISCGEAKIHWKWNCISIVNVGILQAWCLFGLPILIRQYNPNFKVKWYLGNWPVLSLSRRPSLRTALVESHDRSPRLYLSLGSLPFSDNGSGIPRVAKNLCREGLKCKDVNVVPVYPDPVTGIYRCANGWCKKQGLMFQSGTDDDSEITVMPGDWLVHTMINANAFNFDSKYFSSFRKAGGHLGVVLHDIIAEEHPEFFRSRDSRNFSRWLRHIAFVDGIFAVSKATEDEFKHWKCQADIFSKAQIGIFHLGADFKESSAMESALLPSELLARPSFLQVSTLEPRKGYAQLIDAFDHLWLTGTDVNLVIVGRRGWMVSNLVRRIKHHPALNKKLFWFSHATDAELAALYNQSTGVVVASEAEGFGLSVVEGLWYKKPVIARDIPVFREIGGDNLVYFFGKDPEAIAEAVSLVLQSPAKFATKTIKAISWSESFSEFSYLLKQFSSHFDK